MNRVKATIKIGDMTYVAENAEVVINKAGLASQKDLYVHLSSATIRSATISVLLENISPEMVEFIKEISPKMEEK